jgi:hypothetical protein
VLAVIRPGSWDFPLFLHVLGAIVLVGGLVAAAASLVFARGEEGVLRLGYRSLLLLALPGWILMRVGAEWIYSKEGWEDVQDEPAWLGVGYVTADGGGLLLLISLILGGIGVYRLRKGQGSGLLKATMVISLVVLAAYLVAAWAMSGKPG